jgi:hypothetical protein
VNYPKRFRNVSITIRNRQLPSKPPPLNTPENSTDRPPNSISSRKGAYDEQLRQSAEQQGKLRNAQAVADRLADLERQELNLLAEIGRVKNAQELAWRRWTSQDYRNKQAFTDPGEANLPLLKGRLQNVQDEKDPVRKEQERAQRQQ